MYKKKMASGKTVKGGKSDFEKMIKDLGLTKAEIADMLGLTKRDPKTGIRRKKGGLITDKPRKYSGPKPTGPGSLLYGKTEAEKRRLKGTSSNRKPMGKKPVQTMKRGKRVGSAGAITQQQRMAMGKK